MTIPAAAFASGSGTNLQALLDAEERSEGSPYRIEVVVADRSEAGALDRARNADRRAEVVPVSGRSDDEIANRTLELLEGAGIQVIFLAGYLRLVPGPVVEAYRRRILNIHPALLPAFGGKGMYGIRIHEAVLREGARVTGVTVHYVDEEYDTGTIMAQWPVPVLPGDTAESLQQRVLRVEHILYPAAARHLCRALSEGREPEPFRFSADAFALDSGDGLSGTRAAIENAFHPSQPSSQPQRDR